MILVSRLPLSLSFSSLLKFGRIGFVTMKIIFLQCICFPLMTNFELCMSCVYVCCFYLCNASYL